MTMKLEFIGCGAGFSIGLGNNNVMIYNDKPEYGYWLIDCGESTRLDLVQRNLIDSLQGIFITHLHSDHIYGLEMLGFWWYFVKKDRLKLVLPSESMKEQLWQVLQPTMASIQDKEGNPIIANMDTYFDVSVKGNHLIPILGGSIQFMANKHVPNKESCSIIITGPNGIHLFTSDQKDVTLDSQYKTIWHDAQLYNGGKGGVHAYYADVLAGIDSKSNTAVWLMHYNRKVTEEEQAQAKQKSKGFVIPGQIFEL